MSLSTLPNYPAELVMTNKLSLTQSSVAKNNTQFAEEHSIRSEISNVTSIANTHFIEMDEEDIMEVPLEARML